MADQGIKKVIVPQANLPTINSEINGYALRYRVVSEDRNRLSHWSTLYFLLPNYTYVSGDIVISKQANHVSLIWDPVSLEISGNYIRKAREFDIWAKWGKGGLGDWLYVERIEGTSLNLIIPSTYLHEGVDQEESPNELTIEIYLKGNPISRNSSNLLVYNPPTETI